MNERGTEVLKQYNLQVLSTQKTRGAILCDTNEGKKLLKEYRGSIRRLEFEYEVLTSLKERGLPYVDRCLRNEEGNLCSKEHGNEKYILKDWYIGRECDVKNLEEVLLVIRQLATLHKLFRQIPQQESWSLGSVEIPPIVKEYEKHNKELKRARIYMRNKHKKTEFEFMVMEQYPIFYEQAVMAYEGIKKLTEENEMPPKFLCHGEFSHHHLYFISEGIAIVEFSKMHLGIQVDDLYHFMRKIMEKNSWSIDYGQGMLEIYHQELPLQPYEKQYLYYLFLYPEKYWKQINFYYNANKAWIPFRHIEKLKSIQAGAESKNRFMHWLKEKI
ncbi:hypothetical protein FACS189418_6140 [Clostridia bacterium]|nr:hypothetical protein FACS189418_6140 [Clostridia bacterium]